MAKKVKGNHTQNPNRLQKEFFIPCEVFRNERERRESGFPSEMEKELLSDLSKPI